MHRTWSWTALIVVSSTGCGIVGLDVPIEDDHAIIVGDGDGVAGDGDSPGDGDSSGDGDLGLGGAHLGSGGKGSGGKGDGGSGAVDGSGGAVDGSGGAVDGSGGAVDGSGGTEPATGGSDGAGGAYATGGADMGSGGAITSLPPLVHDTFESGEFPVPPERQGTASMALVGDPVHGGSYALRATQGAALADGATITHDLPTFGSGSSIYMAGWIYIPSGTLLGRLDIIRFGSDGSDSLDFGVNVDGRVSVYRNGLGSTSSSAPGKFVVNKWICIQTTVYVHDTNGTYSISIDGTTTLNSSPFDTNLGAGLSYFSYGIVGAKDAQTNDEIIWDDIVVDDSPVACN